MKKRITALMMALLVATLTVMPVFAAPTNAKDPFTYTKAEMDASGGKPKLHKYLVMDDTAEVPPVTFSYTIAPKAKTTTVDSVDYVVTPTSTTLPVYPGVAGVAAIADVSFTSADTTTAGLPTDDPNGTPTTGKKYAAKDIQLDFSACEFKSPGVYRYVLTETKPTDPDPFLYDTFAEGKDNAHTTAYKRTIDVYVADETVEGKDAVTEAWIYNGTEYPTEDEAHQAATDAGDTEPEITHREAQAAVAAVGPKLVVVGYVCYEGDIEATAVDQEYDPASSTATSSNYVLGDPDGSGADDKTDNYVNEYQTVKLQVTKKIAGNQGDKEDTFFVTVKIENIKAGTKVKWFKGLEYTNEIDPADSNTYASSGTWTAGTGDKIEQTIEVTHLDKFLVTGIPVLAKYEVNELTKENGTAVANNGKTEDGYTATYVNNGDTNHNADVELKTKEVTNDLYKVDITNTRTGIIPTGVAISMAGGAGLVALAMVYFMLRRREEDY